MEALVGNTIARILADKGYRGTMRHPFRVFLSGKTRGDAADQARIAPRGGR
jgi:IS5 family transposase